MNAKRAFLAIALTIQSATIFACLNDRDTATYLPQPLSDEQTEVLKVAVG